MKGFLRFFLLPMFNIWTCTANAHIDIGAKEFTESVIIAEILRQKLILNGIDAEPVQELGGTSFLWQALRKKAIQIYSD